MPTYLTPGVYVEEISSHPGSIEGVRTSTGLFVDETLRRSEAFATLPADRRREIAGAMVEIVTAVVTSKPADDRTPGPADILLEQVDFPAFVGDLVHGVFDAIVGASIEQMEAYAELIAGVAKTVDDFAEEVASECEARELLTRALFAGVATTSGACLGS